MTVNRGLRFMAGLMVLFSLVLAVTVNQKWLFLTAFVGVNLLQSAVTNWCPAMSILRKLGLREA